MKSSRSSIAEADAPLRYCLNVHGEMLCDGPKDHDGGCTFVLGWELVRRLEDDFLSLVRYSGDTTNELRETRDDRDEGWRQHNLAMLRLTDAATVIERMANGASRAECSPELDRVIAYLAVPF